VTVRAIAELTRISNLPTVVTNAIVGVALAGPEVGWGGWVFGLGAVSLLYLGGMALNDLVDAEVDAREKASRPIARRVITRRAAFGVTLWCLLGGFVLTCVYGWAPATLGLALLGAITAYDLLHKRGAWTVVLMGVCRALVVPLGAAIGSGAWPIATAWWIGAVIGMYTVLLTLAARGEELGSRTIPKVFAWLTVGAPLLIGEVLWDGSALVWASIDAGTALVCGLGAMIWIARSAALATRGGAHVKPAVLGWLAGFCLIDATVLAAIGRPELAGIALACFVLTTLGHRMILGT